MENKKALKINLVTIVFIFIILILIIAIISIYYFGVYKKNIEIKELEKKYEKEITSLMLKNKEEKKNDELENNIEIEQEESIIGQIKIPNESTIYTYYETIKKGPNFKIPKINIDSNDARKINDEIEEMVENAQQYVEDYNKNNIEGGGPSYIDYHYYINNDILSVVIEYSSGYDFMEYKVYNINVKTGKEYTNEDILKVKNISIDKFEERLSNTLGEQLKEEYKDIENEELKEQYKEIYNKTVSKENCSINNNQLFLDDENDISVVAKEYSIAGAGRYYYVFKLK